MTNVLGFILVMNALLCCGHAEGAILTIDPNWSTFHPGESVTFICDMNEGKDTDWEYEIKKNGEQFLRSNPYKSFTLLPIQIDHSDEYQCCGLRKSSGDTKCSDTVSLTVTAQPKPTLTAGPTTIPVGGSVTLSCSLPSAGWKYKWYIRTKNTPEVQLTDEENRDINVAQAGIYRCLGMRGNENYQSLVSDEVSITISFSNKVVVTRQPNWPQMFSGESITLTCEVQGGETTDWTCEWRRDGKTVKMGNDKHLTVNVNESSSEEYMCQCRRRDDWHSLTKWSEKIPVSVSVTVSTPVSSSSDVLMIIGPVGGILLVLLLVLLWYYRRSKDLRCRWWKLLKISCGVNNGFNKNDTNESSSPLHGDDHIYESVNFSDSSGNVADKPRDATYSLIELKNFGKESIPNEPVEGAVYYRLESGMKGRGRPGAKEEAVYSEINSGPENNNTI
ncbi:leukocyte immunoglobulin-like receptor subfamily A member 6 isoform X1 [Xiphophorus maculatus]|uniref:leukocyte immunoglobulin-like receptor subfamily A member 6 isoform X1 n=1 Tax=Xiphophorus maculatus TaxID=8083 RepID=UPI000C6EF75B|nr:leukocyte immunoglobulin-like receptor subfamily A member 6 isoform X1 [Xiphophorus maculatus]